MRNLKIIIIILSFIALFSGCVSGRYISGEEFKAENVGKLETGKTTEEEVRTLFGEPLEYGICNGLEIYTYLFEDIRFVGAGSGNVQWIQRSGDTLVIEFDEGHIVKNYYYNTPRQKPPKAKFFLPQLKLKLPEEKESVPVP